MVLRMMVQMAAMPAMQDAITMMMISVVCPTPDDDFLDVESDAAVPDDDADESEAEAEPDATWVEVEVTALALPDAADFVTADGVVESPDDADVTSAAEEPGVLETEAAVSLELAETLRNGHGKKRRLGSAPSRFCRERAGLGAA